ncbi:MAG: AraC family transcriptional regulator [Spirochaetales bacterium]|nr:AraC family transcriptional regulator [Spirochaetales bacterium]
MKNLSSRIKPHFFYKLLISINTIVIVIIVVIFFATNYYLSILENNIVESHQNTLQLITKNLINSTMWTSLDNTIKNIISSYSFRRLDRSDHPEYEFASGHPLLGMQDYNYLYKDILHSIYFINVHKGIIITDKGIEKIDSFFKIHFPDLPEYRILNAYISRYPKPAKFYLDINDIYPEYVYPNFYPYPENSENIVMINYSERFYYTFLNQNKTSLNSELFIMRSDGIILAHSNRNKIYTPVNDNTVVRQIKSCKPFYTDYFGDERLIVSCMGIKGLNYYVATIPYKDIYDQPIAIRNILIITGIGVIILCLLISFFISKFLYRPINKLYSLFNPLTEITNKSIDDFTFLENNIANLLADRKRLDLAIPHITNQYLIKILNGDFDFQADKSNELLEREGIRFKYNNFIVSILKFFYTNEFIETHSQKDQLQLINRTYTTIINTLTQSYNTHVVKIKKDTLCTVFNINNDVTIKDIFNIIKDLDGKEDFNQNFISVFYGISEIHNGIEGLGNAYQEAADAVLGLSLYEQKHIALYNSQEKDDKKYHYTANEENMFINYILSGYRDNALQLLNTIIVKNQNRKISIANMKELYFKLYFTGKLILEKKQLSLNRSNINGEINITEAYKDMNVIDLSQHVFNFLLKIINSSVNHKKGKLDVCAVINYINDNFHNDFSLEMIADSFKVSTGHLSYLLKNHLGMSYQGYINDLRIKKAKNLLTQTHTTIDEISGQCGFNSRHTFIRMFKKLEGVTPTQFRVQ